MMLKFTPPGLAERSILPLLILGKPLKNQAVK
jgi:hypothetical protein